MNFARTALTLSILMFLLGFMIMCNCPGWYATSALFAALAAWKGRGKFRVYALTLFGAALLMATVHGVAEYKLSQRSKEIRRKYQQDQSTNSVTTSKDERSSVPPQK